MNFSAWCMDVIDRSNFHSHFCFVVMLQIIDSKSPSTMDSPGSCGLSTGLVHIDFPPNLAKFIVPDFYFITKH